MRTIEILDTDDARTRAFDVMKQLRPHLTLETFLAQARSPGARPTKPRVAAVTPGRSPTGW